MVENLETSKTNADVVDKRTMAVADLPDVNFRQLQTQLLLPTEDAVIRHFGNLTLTDEQPVTDYTGQPATGTNKRVLEQIQYERLGARPEPGKPVSRADGSIATYDEQGRIRHLAKNGVETTFVWSGTKLEGIKIQQGAEQVIFTYGKDGKLDGVTDKNHSWRRDSTGWKDSKTGEHVDEIRPGANGSYSRIQKLGAESEVKISRTLNGAETRTQTLESNGRKIAEFVTGPDGKKIADIHYYTGKSMNVVLYDQEGKKQSSTEYDDAGKAVKFTEIGLNGKRLSVTRYSSDGNPTSKTNYRADEIEQSRVFYKPGSNVPAYEERLRADGKTREKAIYFADGETPARTRQYNAKDELQSEVTFQKDGVKPTALSEFLPGPGERLAKRTEYFENGTTPKSILDKTQSPPRRDHFDTEGRVIATDLWTPQGLITTEFGEKGIRKATITYDSEGKPALRTEYYENGEAKRLETTFGPRRTERHFAPNDSKYPVQKNEYYQDKLAEKSFIQVRTNLPALPDSTIRVLVALSQRLPPVGSS